MRTYPSQLASIAAAHTGIAPAHLLDVMDTNGNFYYWANRKTSVLAAIDASSAVGGAPTTTVTYLPWVLSVPEWKFYRSLQTDMGQIQLQYLSGDTLQRDFDRIVRSTALEGALFVYRLWDAAAEWPYIEVHGTLTVGAPSQNRVGITARQMLNPSADVTPQFTLSEICPWRYGSPQCGATGSVECQHSFPTCQVVERIMVISNNYEKNFGPADANVSVKVMNRIRKF